MPEWLKTEQFGMPRWIWLSLLGGGLALGLYLRSRTSVDDDAQATDMGAIAREGELATAGEGGGGFGGGYTGMSGGAGSGSVVPVQAPFLPEGIVDTFGDLSAITGQLGDQLVAVTTTRDEVTGGGADTGGGPPTVPPEAHTPPPSSDDRGCTTGDKIRLAYVRRRENGLRDRVETINSQIRKAKTRPNFKRNENLQDKVRELHGEKRARVNEIQALASERRRLVGKCG